MIDECFDGNCDRLSPSAPDGRTSRASAHPAAVTTSARWSGSSRWRRRRSGRGAAPGRRALVDGRSLPRPAEQRARDAHRRNGGDMQPSDLREARGDDPARGRRDRRVRRGDQRSGRADQVARGGPARLSVAPRGRARPALLEARRGRDRVLARRRRGLAGRNRCDGRGPARCEGSFATLARRFPALDSDTPWWFSPSTLRCSSEPRTRRCSSTRAWGRSRARSCPEPSRRR